MYIMTLDHLVRTTRAWFMVLEMYSPANVTTELGHSSILGHSAGIVEIEKSVKIENTQCVLNLITELSRDIAPSPLKAWSPRELVEWGDTQ